MTPWTVAHKTPLSMGVSRIEYWSGLPFPSLVNLPDPVIKPKSPALAGGFFTTITSWEAFNALTYYFIIKSLCWTCPLHGVNGKHNCN